MAMRYVDQGTAAFPFIIRSRRMPTVFGGTGYNPNESPVESMMREPGVIQEKIRKAIEASRYTGRT
jgi:hypothetical protein